VPDELINQSGPADGAAAAAAPPIAPPAAPAMTATPTEGDGSRPPRRPSWLRAALISLVIILAGGALGAAGYRLERTYSVQPSAIEKTTDGWTITGQPGRVFSGVALNGPRLIWQDGASIEYVQLGEGTIRLLGPGPGMRTTWDPAIGERYAIWFEAERQESLAAQAVAYDTQSGRRWTLGDVGSVYSNPAISGDLAVWCSASRLGEPAIWGARIFGDWGFPIASQRGAPVVAAGLVVWAHSWTGPFTAREIASGTSWAVTADLTGDRLTSIALAGRTLVWGQGSDTPGTGVVAAVSVDGGGTAKLATGLTSLAGPAYDGKTVVWGEKAATGSRIMGQRLGSTAAFLIATVAGEVEEVAVSGDSVAWIVSSSGAYTIVTSRLAR
jgi:hypothetical protein